MSAWPSRCPSHPSCSLMFVASPQTVHLAFGSMAQKRWEIIQFLNIFTEHIETTTCETQHLNIVCSSINVEKETHTITPIIPLKYVYFTNKSIRPSNVRVHIPFQETPVVVNHPKHPIRLPFKAPLHRCCSCNWYDCSSQNQLFRPMWWQTPGLKDVTAGDDHDHVVSNWETKELKQTIQNWLGFSIVMLCSLFRTFLWHVHCKILSLPLSVHIQRLRCILVAVASFKYCLTIENHLKKSTWNLWVSHKKSDVLLLHSLHHLHLESHSLPQSLVHCELTTVEIT